MNKALQNGYEHTSGVVEQITRKDKRTAVKVGGVWYSTFQPVPPVSEGDAVELAFSETEKNGRVYHNIEDLAVQVSPKAQRETHITRSVALKAAAMVTAREAGARAVLQLAEVFVGWLETGELPGSEQEDKVPF